MRFTVFLLATAFLAASLGTAPADAKSRYSKASHQKADRVIVFKGTRQLVLMKGDRMLKTYRVALGRYADGPKVYSGDGRTPEGSYVLDYRQTKSKFYRAIHISYPSPGDIRRASQLGVSAGGSIMIHGLPTEWDAKTLDHPNLDWTQGCIAVTNREMDEIWAMVKDGTPIEIWP